MHVRAQEESAEAEYDLASDNWNGLSDLMAVAQEAGIRLDTPQQVDLGSLRPEDSLLLFYPQDDLPARSLTEFLRAGGRVAVADDFGEATSFLDVFSIHRADPPDDAQRLRGNEALLVARPILSHPLAAGVGHLITNHPQVVRHRELDAVFGFNAEGEGPVLTGAVQDGRLIVIGDPSVFINNMMQFRGNRRFARNLLQYLQTDTGRVLIVTGRTELRTAYASSRAEAVQRLDDWLLDASQTDLPSTALILLGATFGSLALLFVFVSIPFRSPYGAEAIPDNHGGGGFASRVEYTLDHPHHRAHACLVYRYELHEALRRALNLGAGSSKNAVLRAALDKGLRANELESLDKLLTELDDLAAKVDTPPGTPNVSARDIHNMVDTGESLLSRLENSKSETRT